MMARVLLSALLASLVYLGGPTSRVRGEDDGADDRKPIHVSELTHHGVVGWLGRPLGEIVVIEGVTADGDETRRKLDTGKILLHVQAVNGRKLAKGHTFHYEPFLTADLPEPRIGTKFKYVGYETGGFRGVPAGAFKYVPAVQTAGYRFTTGFVVLKALPAKEP